MVAELAADDLVGHVAGDEFVIVCSPARAPRLATLLDACFSATIVRHEDTPDAAPRLRIAIVEAAEVDARAISA